MFGLRRQSDYLSNAASSADPLFSSVVLLLKANQADGATTFVDSSSYHRTPTAVRAMTNSTAQTKYGISSIFNNTVNGGGSGSQNGAYISYAASSDFVIQSGAWCFDWWMKVPLNLMDSNGGEVNTNITYAGSVECGNITFNRTVVSIYLGPGSSASPEMRFTKVDDGQWHHYAIQKAAGSNAMRMWADGVEKTVYGETALFANAGTPTFQVGRSNVGAYAPSGFYIDDFRLTKAVRYSTNFTPTEAATS